MAKKALASPPVEIDIQIERWPIERLIPRANNPRTHSREQVAQIAASIKEFGWTNPVEEMLRIELAILHEEDYDLNLVGFDDIELQRLLEAQDNASGLTDEDSVPEVQ